MKIDRNEYNNTSISGARLTPGGHKCVIKSVTEGKAKSGKDMLIVMFDTTTEDSQPQFYTEDYMSQSGEKKWRGCHYIVMGTEYSMKNFKQFCTALEHSHGLEEGTFVSEEGMVRFDAMKNLKVGIVFGEEEYKTYTGRIGTSVKSRYFCDYAEAESKEVPEKKCLAEPQANEYGFMEVKEDNPEGLPFR